MASSICSTRSSRPVVAGIEQKHAVSDANLLVGVAKPTQGRVQPAIETSTIWSGELLEKSWRSAARKALRAKAGLVAARPIERNDGFGRNLPCHGDVGETRIDGGRRVLSARAVKPELNDGHPLIQRLVPGRPTIEAACQIERAVLDRKAPVQGFDTWRQNGLEPSGREARRERHGAG